MKQRLDIFLTKNKFFESREKAQTEILESNIVVNGKVVKKPSFPVSLEDKVEVLNVSNKYVSKGGLKLEKAIIDFDIDVKGKVCLDIGASTGGFTDVLLQNKAKKIYAVENGTDQLHPKIKKSKRVIDMSNTDIRKLNTEIIAEADIIVIDVSFISVGLFMKLLSKNMKEGALIVQLFKPQFECGPMLAKKHRGVIREESVHENLIKKFVANWRAAGLNVHDIIPSPILGGSGNIEYLALLKRQNTTKTFENVVREAFKTFERK